MTTQSKELSNTYGKGYFYGEGSGYPKTGYSQSHPDWREYINFIHSLKGSAIRWLDVGCAYGYLLKEAEEKGVSAFGLDISTFALNQVPEVRPHLVQGLANDLPFADETFEVVTAFDLVEHLPDPEKGIKEMVRVLKNEGVLLFSTPDPLLFKRKEETHLSEHPPSYWMDQVGRLGLEARLRFFGEPFNLEIIAVKSGDVVKAGPLLEGFNRDYFGNQSDIVKASSGKCQIALRRGWSELTEKPPGQGIRYFRKQASLYIFNGERNPLEAGLQFRLKRNVSLQLNAKLENIGIEGVNKKEGVWHFKTGTFFLPPGGHEIIIRCQDTDEVEVHGIDIHFSEKEFSQYNLSLPIDQYQRYRILQQSVDILRNDEEPKRILEVGGAPGQIAGFLPQDDITIVDVEHCDIPNFQVTDGLNLPFADKSFDIAASIDTLEHVAPHNRETFLSELIRVSREYVFLGAPFADPALRQAEQVLFEFIHTKLHHIHRFLDEHLSQALPDKEETEEFFKSQGLRTIVLPNGYLSHWLILMMVYFYLEADPRLNRIKRLINQYYNKNHYPSDNRPPAYRHLIIGCKHSLPEKKTEALKALISSHIDRGPANFTPAALLLELVNLDLLNEKDRVIQELEKTSNEKDKTVQELITHSENLQKVIKEKDESIKSLNEGLQDLEARLLASLEQNSFLFGRIDELEARLESYHQHIQNLERIVDHPLVKSMRAGKRILSLILRSRP